MEKFCDSLRIVPQNINGEKQYRIEFQGCLLQHLDRYGGKELFSNLNVLLIKYGYQLNDTTDVMDIVIKLIR